jgi:hypothetical protein
VSRLARAFVIAAVIVGAALLPGCSSAASGALVLTWTFADGRDCLTAGAMTVEARAYSSPSTAPLATFDCGAGLTPGSVTIAAAPGSGTLYVDALDNSGVDLYRGTLSLDDEPPGTGSTRSVTLIANAAQ